MAIPTSTMSAGRAGRAKVGRFGVLIAALAWCLAPAAVAQTIFFDGFDGPQLHPRWNTPGPNGSVWSYDFENSMFNLRDVQPVVAGKVFRRPVALQTAVSLVGDFRVEARIGWSAGGPLRAVGLALSSGPPGNATVYALSMSEIFNGSPAFLWQLPTTNPPGSVPAPAGGFASIALVRSASSLRALIDGIEIARFDGPVDEIQRLSLQMVGDSRGMSPLHIDSVTVVPSPSAIMLGGVAIGLIRRRRSTQ